MTEKFTPAFLAEKLNLHPPTDEQAAIIEAPLASGIVIAGAGSGKTETMANRVVYLIANGLVRPDEVLGLTFTRKAAAELADRIRRRVHQLSRAGLVPKGADDELLSARVTTYNSFANSIFSEYAHLIGRDPDAHVMSDATSWQLARRICIEAASGEVADMDKNLVDVTAAVRRLSGAFNDNMVTAEAFHRFTGTFLGSVTENLDDPKPYRGQPRKSKSEALKKGREAVTNLHILEPLVRAYQQAKIQRGAIEFSDQVALAHDIAVQHPTVGQLLREQYKVILLDEYQDTSSVQIELLSTLFTGAPVTAVGDPNQAIYGWRGASASSMHSRGFFAAYGSTPGQSKVFTLSASWRNPAPVLNAANAIAAGLPTDLDELITLTPGIDDKPGEVTVRYLDTIREEAEMVAAWIEESFASAHAANPNAQPTAALLSRRVSDLEPFKRAFEAHNIRYHVVGLGGLLNEPLIVDLICMLRVMHDPTADSELIRLLAGARWRVAARDIKALKKISDELAKLNAAGDELSGDVRAKLRGSVSAEDGATLVDALDYLVENKIHSGKLVAQLSAAGLERLHAVGEQIARLRRRVGLDLRSLVTAVVHELQLDIEADANEMTSGAQTVLDAFGDVIVNFLGSDDAPTLGSFLSWLAEAEKQERMSPSAEAPEGDVVQLLTVHGAKGLEWDYVAVPRQCTPAKAPSVGWFGLGELPDDLRADRAELGPAWEWQKAANRAQLQDSFDEYKEGAKRRNDEEQRRLAYVAYTRAKRDLLLTGSWWFQGETALRPNVFLRDLETAGLLPEGTLPADDAIPVKDTSQLSNTAKWPLAPFGERAERAVRVHAAAVAVSSAVHQGLATRPDVADEIELLVAERDRRAQGAEPLELPVRIPASRFKDFVDATEDMQLNLRRPMPEQPYKATTLGTVFHAWVEQRSIESALPALVEDAAFELDKTGADEVTSYDPAALVELQATFEKSPWGSRKPVDIEREIHFPLLGNIIICKIDAVYENIDATGNVSYEIVDWKTGKAPKDANDLESKQFQLALYRQAYARITGIPPERIDAVFYYVADDAVIRPDRLYSESELEERWSSVTGSMPR